jgi:sugar-specific transcriptional regulator TrmB
MIEKERDELVNGLVSYGLTPVQAQVYLTLLKLGATTAKSISRTSGINRVDIYRALRHLKKLGLIEEKLGNPTEFLATEPSQALDILLSHKLRVVDRLRASKSELWERLKEFVVLESNAGIVAEEEREGTMFLKVVWGGQQFRRVQSVVMHAKREIITIFAPSVMLIYDQIGIPELEAEKQRQTKVKIRAITNITPENLEASSLYSKVVELRHNELPPSQLRYTIADDEKLILPVGEPPHDVTEGTALWTNSKVLIAALKADFETLWADSIPANERIGQLLSKSVQKKEIEKVFS